MPAYHGKSGRVNFASPGITLNVIEWSLDISADVVDVSSMTNSSGYKERVVGFKDWSATVTAHIDDSTLIDPALTDLGTSGTLDLDTLTGAGGLLFSVGAGGAIVKAIDFDTSASGSAKVIFKYIGNGVTPTLSISAAA